jgi:hypothetical protein
MRCKDKNEFLTGKAVRGISKLLSVSVNCLGICLEKLLRNVMNTGQDIRTLRLNVASGLEICCCRTTVLNSSATASSDEVCIGIVLLHCLVQ